MPLKPLMTLTRLLALAMPLGLLPLHAKSAGTAVASFEQLKPLTYQVMTAYDASGSHNSYGSGFVISQKGFLMTNFHVLRDAFWRPKLNRIFVRMGEKLIEARIADVDVLNDLAILHINHRFPKTVPIAPGMPKHGAPVYALGLPENLNWSITSGLYNGVVDVGIYKSIHLSSPLNSGMSGGPTVDEAGRLIGVNAAILTKSQNISFSVPLETVKALLARLATYEDDLPPAATHLRALRDRAREQLITGQDQLTELLIKGFGKTKVISGWRVSDFSERAKCSSDLDRIKSGQALVHLEWCSLDTFNARIAQSYPMTRFIASYDVGRNVSMHPLGFMQLRDSISRDSESWRDEHKAKKQKAVYSGAFRCQAFREETTQVPLEVCTAPIHPFSDLYEAYITILQADGNKSFVNTFFFLDGFTSHNIMRMVAEALKHLGRLES